MITVFKASRALPAYSALNEASLMLTCSRAASLCLVDGQENTDFAYIAAYLAELAQILICAAKTEGDESLPLSECFAINEIPPQQMLEHASLLLGCVNVLSEEVIIRDEQIDCLGAANILGELAHMLLDAGVRGISAGGGS